jgi:hypothetical protein
MAKILKKRRVSMDGMRHDSAESKKIQLRRCAICQKSGHNKSTCPEAVPQINAGKTVRQPLQFFIHHVNYGNHQSGHLVDLKERKNNLYENVQPAAPALPAGKLEENKNFYFYHDLRAPSFSPKTKNKKQPVFLRPQNIWRGQRC